MSGIFSVPFGALAAFSDSSYSRLIWGALAFLAIVVTIYQIWAKERKRVNNLEKDLEKERDHNLPKLQGQIEEIGCFNSSELGSCLHISLRITNTGAPTIVDKYLILFKVNSKVEQVSSCILPSITLPDKRTSTEIILKDYIFEKTIVPIPTGGMVRGSLLGFNEKAKDGNYYKVTGAIIEVSFEDVTGKRYFSKWTISGIPDEKLYFPGRVLPRAI